ncbi:hypothetical protein EAY64_01615 [Aquitalea palustris]|uniref:Solute-binding protein family 3/N-terminal domain-containing protein n=1 Tax=Aquitalea palustris TaxID=2480983 RepID=A0A454JND9_9NEIS|nr:transporter substrate-binding domain-containing protein [Aquitalea palustris]RMD01803.1 hypothetical protein EAY64_01615 [Aquitalea palustris]
MYPRLLLLFVLLWCNPASASPLIAYTEELPPLNFLQHDKVSGFSSELLQAMADKAAIPLTLQLLPWARGYAMTQSTPGSLLFSTVRTPERENLFRWVGPISPRRIYLYRLTRRKDIQLRNIEQLKQLRTSTLFESATQKRLLELGLRIGEEQDSGRSDAVNLGKLLLGRVDLVAMLDWAMAWQLQQSGQDAHLVQAVALLDGDSQYWYALNRQTPEETVRRLQAALNALETNGYAERLRQKYMGRDKAPAHIADFTLH